MHCDTGIGKYIISKNETLYVFKHIQSVEINDINERNLYFMNDDIERTMKKYVKVVYDDKENMEW